MNDGSALAGAAKLFKVLSGESRLRLLVLLGRQAQTVGALSESSGLSQPLVSQHLRTLRLSGLVRAERSGREVTYHVADHHISHVIADALVHAQEAPTGGVETESEETHHA
ncbi:metalloregulator ArsR/SmtB family transcription factor [Sinomonas albida]|uniref:ArsR/SmtB family transcription factor n=1 Tax=Sinomonas albida TaxID=369942 RepID=UPI003017AC30